MSWIKLTLAAVSLRAKRFDVVERAKQRRRVGLPLPEPAIVDPDDVVALENERQCAIGDEPESGIVLAHHERIGLVRIERAAEPQTLRIFGARREANQHDLVRGVGIDLTVLERCEALGAA